MHPLEEKIKAEVMQAFELYYEAFWTNSQEKLLLVLHPEVRMIGTRGEELFQGREQVGAALYKMVKETHGRLRFENSALQVWGLTQDALIEEMADIFVFQNEEWTFYSAIRLTHIFSRSDEKWLLSYLHASVPDAAVQSGETIGFLQLQKENKALHTAVQRRTQQLATKNRELEIEASLERVRAQAMKMERSEDLIGVATLLYKELNTLGVSQVVSSGFVLVNEEKKIQNVWGAKTSTKMLEFFQLPLFGDDVFQNRYDAWKRQEPYYRQILHADELSAHLDVAMPKNTLSDRELESQEDLPDPTYFYFGNFQQGYLQIIAAKALSKEQLLLLPKFAKVFEQAYIRYLDLKNAEKQLYNARVETALERVRARTMAMRDSSELREVIAQVFQQLQNVGFETPACGLIIYKEDYSQDLWISGFEKDIWPESYHIPYNEQPYYQKQLQAFKEQIPFAEFEIKGAEKIAYDEWVFTHSDFKNFPPQQKEIFLSIEEVINSDAVMRYGMIEIVGKLNKKQADTLQRFAQVFEQTYTRFLDLQKAEKQTREAEIQLALERVRARTMAMHQSEELKEVVAVLYQQIESLQLGDWGCNIQIFNKDKNQIEIWLAEASQQLAPQKFLFPEAGHPDIQRQWEAWEKQVPFFYLSLEGAQKINYDNYILEHTEFKFFPSAVKADIRSLKKAYFSGAYMRYGYIVAISTNDLLPLEQMEILQRFAQVFEQTYTRFLDLQKAENQAREAQLEAALEKVRSRTMAMQKSEELRLVISEIFEQLQILKLDISSCSLVLYDEEDLSYTIWIAGFGTDKFPKSYRVPYFDHPYYKAQLEAWKSGIAYEVFPFEGELKVSYDDFVFEKSDYRDLPESAKKEIRGMTSAMVCDAFMRHGMLEIVLPEKERLSAEQASTLQRFAKVFEQTYTRFLDLQKAEAQAREARIESSLEKVRVKAIEIDSSQELGSIVQTMYQELENLGILTETSDVELYLIEEDTGIATLWGTESNLTTNFGTVKFPLLDHPTLQQEYKTWKDTPIEKRKEILFNSVLEGKSLEDTIHFIASLPELAEAAESFRAAGITKWSIQNAYFSHGMISLQGISPAPEEIQQLLVRFTTTFEQSYIRFLDLRKAEKQAVAIQQEKTRLEKALEELKATQSQLIQQEKLASLGQLTAGIAHEIKNPLNFVNNFSEVSKELLEELQEEIDKEDWEEVKSILQDVQQNLDKIQQHGSRADSIVKSMLQHSRGGSGHPEPTHLNELVREFVHLAFHGMRAGKKPINVTIEYDLDETIGQVNLVQEDFSRVILNLVNNAFDALASEGYLKVEPHRLSITTYRQNETVQLSITDNGPGIPTAIQDKILQPFFTTKKGKEGTGLGLSISNDIVKAHGGTLSILSKQGAGTTFRIQLPVS